MKWIEYLNICLKVLTLTNKKEGATPSFVFILKKLTKQLLKPSQGKCVALII